MSRDIKFRAWNGKAMCYGGFSIHSTGKFISTEDERVLAGFTDNDPPVMQYTGLKDKHGTDIYERDLVKIILLDPLGDNVGDYVLREVEYLAPCFRAGVFDLNNKCEVIGNSFENPGLSSYE